MTDRDLQLQQIIEDNPGIQFRNYAFIWIKKWCTESLFG